MAAVAESLWQVSTHLVATLLVVAGVIRDARAGVFLRLAFLLGDGVDVPVHVAHKHDARARARSGAVNRRVADHALHELGHLLAVRGIAVARTSHGHERSEEEDTRHGSQTAGVDRHQQSAAPHNNNSINLQLGGGAPSCAHSLCL